MNSLNNDIEKTTNQSHNELTIIEDTRQQTNKHTIKHIYFDSVGVKIVRSKLPVGDYANIKNMSVVIDTKKDIHEIIGNVAGKQHERFRNECELAKSCGIHLIVLIENTDNVQKLDDLKKWYNYRLKKNKFATTGRTLFKILTTMSEKYGVEFQFCSPYCAGEKIVQILGNL